MRKILWLTTSSMSLEPIINSLDNYELFKQERIFFDKFGGHYQADIIDHQVEVFNPEAILYAGPANGPFMPNPLDIRRLRDKAPIVNIICDGGCPGSPPRRARAPTMATLALRLNQRPTYQQRRR